MKILNHEEPWKSKVNFVDENEVHLGYDLNDDCCAHGGWFINESPEFWPKGEYGSEWPKEPSPYPDLPGWTFDTAYFKDRTLPFGYAEGTAIQFRIVNGDKEQFITLYNCHNGYYGKGFEFVVPKDTSKNREDTL
jgi:hypothetical protein